MTLRKVAEHRPEIQEKILPVDPHPKRLFVSLPGQVGSESANRSSSIIRFKMSEVMRADRHGELIKYDVMSKNKFWAMTTSNFDVLSDDATVFGIISKDGMFSVISEHLETHEVQVFKDVKPVMLFSLFVNEKIKTLLTGGLNNYLRQMDIETGEYVKTKYKLHIDDAMFLQRFGDLAIVASQDAFKLVDIKSKRVLQLNYKGINKEGEISPPKLYINKRGQICLTMVREGGRLQTWRIEEGGEWYTIKDNITEYEIYYRVEPSSDSGLQELPGDGLETEHEAVASVDETEAEEIDREPQRTGKRG